MAKDFRAVTEALFAKIGVEDLAREIGCSGQTVKQARMEGDSLGRRSPPPGWEKAVRKLAIQRATRLAKLVADLEPQTRPGANDP